MLSSVPSPTAHGGRAIRTYLDVLRRWVWLLALCALVGGAGAFVASKLMHPTYRATTLLVVGPPTTGSDLYNGLLASDQLVTTYLGLITQPVVLQRAAAQVPGATARQLASHVSVKDQAGTQIIELDVDDASPARAAQLANAIANAFIGMQHEGSSAALAQAQQQVNQQLAQVSAEIAKLTTNVDTLRTHDSTNPRLQVLQQQLSAALAHRDTLQTVSAQLTTQQIMATNSVGVFQPASPPLTPDHPKPILNAAIGGVLGLVVAAALVWLLEYFDDRIRTAERAEERLGLPLLTAVGRYPGRALLLGTTAPSQLGRDIDVLLANLDLGDLPRTVAVTSANPGEGRTTVAVNLSIALARAGKRVLLVDGDLHPSRTQVKLDRKRPMGRHETNAHMGLHDVFGIPNSFGLPGVMDGDIHEASAPSSVAGIPNLYVLPAGPEVHDPSEVFRSGRVHHFLHWVVGDPASARVDAVVIDTPPTTACADAALLARWVDATLLVVDARHSHAETVLHAKQMLLQARARIVGVVLNWAPGAVHEPRINATEDQRLASVEELGRTPMGGAMQREHAGSVGVPASQHIDAENGLWRNSSVPSLGAPVPQERWSPVDRPDHFEGQEEV